MRKNINLNKNQIIALVALAEGIKTSRPMTGPADLLDLSARLAELAKACDDRNTDTISASVNGISFFYPNANALVTKAGLKVEAEANRLVAATLHLIEDLYTGHASGTVVIGGIPTSDTDGDTEVSNDQYGRIAKYVGSIKVDCMPTGICDGTVLHRVPTGMTAGHHVKKRYGK